VVSMAANQVCIEFPDGEQRSFLKDFVEHIE
jgi:ATP-dependent DNA helicase RecQ